MPKMVYISQPFSFSHDRHKHLFILIIPPHTRIQQTSMNKCITTNSLYRFPLYSVCRHAVWKCSCVINTTQFSIHSHPQSSYWMCKVSSKQSLMHSHLIKYLQYDAIHHSFNWLVRNLENLIASWRRQKKLSGGTRESNAMKKGYKFNKY